MMAPKPYSEAVLREASMAPATAALMPRLRRAFTLRNESASTSTMAATRAISTDQRALTLARSMLSPAMPRVERSILAG
ncbi:hypothetical protein D3C72_2074210 [compost metagenome]